MIDILYKTLQTIVNKEQDGYVSPEEYNEIAKQAQDKIFRSYFPDFNRDKNKEKKGLTNMGYGDLSSNQEERIDQFSKEGTIPISSGVYPLPSDLYYIQQYGILTSTGKVVDKVPKNRINFLQNSLSGPSDTYPVYKRVGNSLTIYPTIITGDITISYIKTPSEPKWTYQIVDNKELYDPSNGSFQDFELHPSEAPNLLLEMLSYFGINLREGEVIQIAEQLKNTLNIKDNV